MCITSRCVASRAGIRIVSQELAKPCVSELSVLAPDEQSSVEGPKMQKDGFTGRRPGKDYLISSNQRHSRARTHTGATHVFDPVGQRKHSPTLTFPQS